MVNNTEKRWKSYDVVEKVEHKGSHLSVKFKCVTCVSNGAKC